VNASPVPRTIDHSPSTFWKNHHATIMFALPAG
jgi:hypothetical protein